MLEYIFFVCIIYGLIYFFSTMITDGDFSDAKLIFWPLTILFFLFILSPVRLFKEMILSVKKAIGE